MPVFHTKTIESILEPVALQVNTDFLLLFIDNYRWISPWKRLKTVCCCFVHSSCDFPAIVCKFSHIYLLIFVTTTLEQIYLLNNLRENYRFLIGFYGSNFGNRLIILSHRRVEFIFTIANVIL